MFEIAACYFPVTFNPKPGDPMGISRQDLVDALRNAFTASQSFAPYSIPFLIDKITSSSESAKVILF